MLKTLKKAMALLLAFVMLTSLCACSSDKLTGTTVEQSESSDSVDDALLTQLSDAMLLSDDVV